MEIMVIIVMIMGNVMISIKLIAAVGYYDNKWVIVERLNGFYSNRDTRRGTAANGYKPEPHLPDRTCTL